MDVWNMIVSFAIFSFFIPVEATATKTNFKVDVVYNHEAFLNAGLFIILGCHQLMGNYLQLGHYVTG